MALLVTCRNNRRGNLALLNFIMITCNGCRQVSGQANTVTAETTIEQAFVRIEASGQADAAAAETLCARQNMQQVMQGKWASQLSGSRDRMMHTIKYYRPYLYIYIPTRAL
jgi:hypothetical protein